MKELQGKGMGFSENKKTKKNGTTAKFIPYNVHEQSVMK